ncbi:NUDIX hydrolase [Thiohalophilus sp.]|uniref:NUDIX hydrolase n=1 Tax=Thiohalophilus sp. TaxID=3028392 RepID=UPI002ACEDDCB|nr:NUDIX hydrolase [Thiohalophilus sp.]MDZ7662207.1 NUDIX hydrolase [Thiohalophilus sp.]
MKYCSECGNPVTSRVPEGDNRPRYVCDQCQTIHYRNPNIVAGTLPVWEDKVLLCKRAIEPRYGTWTLPAGFMELGETMEQAALRESEEEACANVAIDDIYTLISLPHVNQVYVLYRARLLDLDFCAGDESLEVRLFSEAEIPWQQLAFRTIHYTLEKYFADRRQGCFSIYTHTINANNRAPHAPQEKE